MEKAKAAATASKAAAARTASSAATARTVLQLVAASNHRVKVPEWGVSFDGASNTAVPVLVELVRQSSAGSGSGAITLSKADESTDETLQTTSIDGCTSEPTGTEVVHAELVHPQAGYTWQSQFGGELLIKGGTRLGIRCTAPAGVNVKARFTLEE